MKDRLISQAIEENGSREYYKNFKFDHSDEILEPHNQAIYEKIINGLTRGNKVLFTQATGTGKSYLSIKFLHDNAKGKRVLFVAPSNAIESAFREKYQEILGDDFCQFDTCLYQGLSKNVANNYDIIIFDELHHMGAKVWGANSKALMDNNPNAVILGMTATLDRIDGVDVRQYFDNKKVMCRS